MNNHSFVVLAYGDSPYLQDCLSSLKNQTVESNIYITTSTPSPFILTTAQQYGVEVFTTVPGKGITHDWNFGLVTGDTKYVTLAHQDDVYLPDYTLKCLQAAERFPDTLICFSDYSELVNANERASNRLLRIKRFTLSLFMPFKKNIKSRFWKKRSLSLGNSISCPAVMYNMHNLPGFRFSKEFSINLDWYAWLTMAKMKGRFVYVPEILMQHRIHSDSETTAGLKGNIRQEEDMRMFREFWPAFFAKFLVKLYAGGYKSNKVNDKTELAK